MNDAEILKERYELALGRIGEIGGEHFGNEELERYFAFCAEFLLLIEDTRLFLEGGGLQRASLEELKAFEKALMHTAEEKLPLQPQLGSFMESKKKNGALGEASGGLALVREKVTENPYKI